MITPEQYAQFQKMMEDIDAHGWGKFTISWQDGEITSVKSEKSFKPVQETTVDTIVVRVL